MILFLRSTVFKVNLFCTSFVIPSLKNSRGVRMVDPRVTSQTEGLREVLGEFLRNFYMSGLESHSLSFLTSLRWVTS